MHFDVGILRAALLEIARPPTLQANTKLRAAALRLAILRSTPTLEISALPSRTLESHRVPSPTSKASKLPSAIAAAAAYGKKVGADMGAGLVRRITELERAPRSVESGVWYPMDYKQCLLDAGLPVPEEIMDGMAPADFERNDTCSFRVRPFTSANKALDAFFAGPTVADCGSVLIALQYAELRETLGVERFDDLFGSAHALTPALMRMHLDVDSVPRGSGLGYFVRFTDDARSEAIGKIGARPCEVGDLVYFAGVPDYSRKHPMGAGPGWNVYYCGLNEKNEQLFHGFGLKEPRTEAQIRSLLVELHNRERTAEDLEFIAKCRTRTAFDIEAYGVPDKVTDAASSIDGFISGYNKGFDGSAVIAAQGDSVDVVRAAILAHTINGLADDP